MKQKYLLVIQLLVVAFGYAQTTKNVYFIGNSYTYYNNLPELVQKIALSTNDELVYESHTPGGSRFQQHAGNAVVLDKIAEGNWDYVVLQEQSQLPSFPQQQLETMVYPYARQLVNAVKAANPCGTPLFYMTWGRKTGDAQNCANGLPYLCTYEGMDDALYNAYMNMATTNSSVVSPVGKVWRKIRELYPDVELYDGDQSHPSYTGSLAAAFTFYTVIYKKDPTLSSFVGELTQQQAADIKGIVKAVVFDHPETWFVGVHDIPTRFQVTQLQNNTYKFESQNPTATTYLWNFGDGTTATVPNPQHTYQQTGTYQVSLTTDACGSNTTATQSVTVATLSNAAVSRDAIRVYPNPAINEVSLSKADLDRVEVFDVLGKKMDVRMSAADGTTRIDVRNLSPGMYFIRALQGTANHSWKIVKQ